MKQNYFLFIFFLSLSYFGFAQTNILCPKLLTQIKIEDTNNIPTVSDNGDGTITLTHIEPFITDIFSNYTIYDFYQYSPSSNPDGELFKYYSIVFQSKDLINELKQKVPSGIFNSYSSYDNTPISPDLINFLDGKKFNFKKHCGIADNAGEPCPEESVPNDFNLKIEFNYDSNSDLLIMKSFGLTPHGNSFSIALKGGTVNNSFQTWESTLGTVVQINLEESPYAYIENDLYSILDISCSNGNFGDIIPTINTTDNTLFLYRNNFVFGYNTVTFEEDVLSTKENTFEKIKLITSNNTRFVEFSNIKTQDFHVEVFSILGEKIIEKIPYQNNTISLNTFQNGLYIIKLSNSNNDFKIFKYLN